MKRAPHVTPTPQIRRRAWPRAGWLALLLSCVAATASAQQRYWYDGEQRRPLWAESAVVAEFSSPGTKHDGVLKPAALARGKTSAQSPVYRDAKDGSGPTRALPGGVIVRFRSNATDAQRRELMARHGLEAVRELGDGSGMWLIRSEPGLPSLDLANRLYESGDFAAAAPNWWQPRTLK